jgi:tRNA(adenine34) deaminase
MTELSQSRTADERFMMEAIAQAERAAVEGNWPVGCVVVFRGEIVARAHNTGYTDHNMFAHAEIKALSAVSDLLDAYRDEAILYSTYEPCPMCFGAIVASKIRRVVYGANIDGSGALSMADHLPPFFRQDKFKFEITGGVLAKECADVFLSGKIGKRHFETEIKNKRGQ